MHETTRKLVCRWAFFVLCVAPTLLTAAWAAYENRPARTRDAARELARLARLDTTIEGLATPRPNVVEAVSIAFSEFGYANAAIELNDVRMRRSGAAAAIAVDDAVVTQPHREAMLASLAARLSQPELQILRCRVRGVLFQPPAATDLKGVRLSEVEWACRAESARDAGGIRLHLRAVGSNQRPIELSLKRSASGTIEVNLDVSRGGLPLWLIGPSTPLAGLAPAAMFRGVIEWRIDGEQSSGRLAGTLTSLDLGDLLPKGSIHTARGTATVRIDDLQFAGTRIIRAAGTVESSSGEVSDSLLASARFLLGDAPPQSEARLSHRFDALVARLELDGQGLTISGAQTERSDLPAGALAVSGPKVLLSAPAERTLPAAALAQLVAGLADRWQWLPANAGAIELLRRMPRAELASAEPTAATK